MKNSVIQVIDEQEKLTALSNRRLKVESLPPFKLFWSIDRITLVGTLKSFNFEIDRFVNADGEILFEASDYTRFGHNMELPQAMAILESFRGAIKVKNDGSWNLVDKFGENIAYVEILPFADDEGNEKGRIDFNPNKIQEFLKTDLTSFIKLVLDRPHFSRADIACDIYDLPDDYVMQYRVADPVSFRPYYGKGGKLETAYWGARSSERQIRLYNKRLEQSKKKQACYYDFWWRLELQLRRSKADIWTETVYQTLDSFYSPLFFPLETKTTDKAMILGLHSDPSLFSELSKKTRLKYRNLMKKMAREDELTQHLKSSFSESVADLKKELESWLGLIEVEEASEHTIVK